MNKIINGLLICGVALAMTGCLDEDPKYTQNSNVIFANENNAQMALNGVYSYMSVYNGYGQYWWEVPVMTSGMMRGTHAQVMGRASDLNMSPADTEYYGAAWTGMYNVINEANAFLNSLEQASFKEETVKRMGNEAKFLRAVAYYNLAAHYGDVPLNLGVPSGASLKSSRVPVMEVLEQVVKDFTDAMELPGKNVMQAGRANGLAAEAYLGKVYFKMAMLSEQNGDETAKQEYLQQAKTCFDNVYGQYKLASNTRNDLFPFVGFLGACPSDEVIFQIIYDDSSTQSDQNMNRQCYQRFCPSQSTPITAMTGQNTFMKYIYDWHYGTYPGDPRVDVNFATLYTRIAGNWNGVGAPVMGSYPRKVKNPGNATTWFVVELNYDDFADKTNPKVEEIQNFTTTKTYSNDPWYGTATATQIQNMTRNLVNTASDQTNNSFILGSNNNAMNVNTLGWPMIGKAIDQSAAARSGAPIIVYRYAEMLLLMADVYNELGQTAKAVQLADEVLARARNMGSTTGEPTWQGKGYNLGDKETVKQLLYNERIIELAGEPSIFDMTRIRGKKYLNSLLVLNNRHNITKACVQYSASTPQNFRDILFDNGSETQLSDAFLTKVMLWPIPQTEIDTNPGITPADQNPGY